MENLLSALEEKSRKPGISEPEQDHINKTIKTLWKGLEELKSTEQSVDFDPESEDFRNPSVPVETNETGIPTSASERISRSSEVTAAKRIKEFRNQEKVEEDKEIFPQRPKQTKPIGESLRNRSGDKSPSGPERFPSTEADKRHKTQTHLELTDATHEPTVQHHFDLREENTMPEDLQIDQRKKLLLGPEAQTTRKTFHETHEMSQEGVQTRCVTSSAERSMDVEAETNTDLGDEMSPANHHKIAQRKQLDMLAGGRQIQPESGQRSARITAPH